MELSNHCYVCRQNYFRSSSTHKHSVSYPGEQRRETSLYSLICYLENSLKCSISKNEILPAQLNLKRGKIKD